MSRLHIIGGQDGVGLVRTGFEYRVFGVLPQGIHKDQGIPFVHSSVSWSSLVIPGLRQAFCFMHETDNPEELQALMAKLKA